jgi:MtfA peptidase
VLLPSLLLAAVLGLLGAALFDGPESLAGVPVGLALGAYWGRRRKQRSSQRQALLEAPFPTRWRTILAHRCDTYRRLPPDWQERFERAVRVFLADKRITGVGVAVTEELRVLVAASAVTLSVGWEGYEWSPLTEVLLYPQDFDRDYNFGARELHGQAHPWGTVILSVPALRKSFAYPDDAFHVGFHEFAHLLDLEGSLFDGAPRGLSESELRGWMDVLERERARLSEGGIIDPYGQDDPAEFFAVAVEAFFECPEDIESRHPRLFGLFRDFFHQDPAAWDRARFG